MILLQLTLNKKQKISDLQNNLENLTNLQTNFDRIVSKIRNVQSEKKQIDDEKRGPNRTPIRAH